MKLKLPGALFYPKYPTAKLCFDCWRERERERAFEIVAIQREELARLRSSLAATTGPV